MPVTGKNIVVCLDGTGNQFAKDNTNVVKLFRVLERDPDQQVVFYDPGVGTLADPSYKTGIGKKVNRTLGLAFGVGLKKNVGEAYEYLMNTYQPGDRLFLFGFSRGAYTARALAGFLHAVGLLDRGCRNLIPYAMRLFSCKKVDFEVLAKFKSTYGQSVTVDFLGLWDSVSTLGWIWDPIFLPYTVNNSSVRTIRHGLAIDEHRAFFQPVLWGDRYASQQDIKEVWFAGVHCDIGGGYPEAESQLAKIALAWMIRESKAENLLVNSNRYDRYVMGSSDGKYVGPDYNGPQHDSMNWRWRLIQHLPKSVWSWEHDKKVMKLPPKRRTIAPGSTLHHTVLDRVNSSAIEYLPPNLDHDTDRLKKQFGIER